MTADHEAVQAAADAIAEAKALVTAYAGLDGATLVPAVTAKATVVVLVDHIISLGNIVLDDHLKGPRVCNNTIPGLTTK